MRQNNLIVDSTITNEEGYFKFENKQIENKVPTNSRPIIKLENRPSENKIQQKRRENDQPKQQGFREKEN